MNIEKLRAQWQENKNIEYKYKELCKVLEVEEKKRGNSRSGQLKDWARYFNFYKPNPKGQKYIIDEIYDTPKQKVDGRGKSDGSRCNNSGGIYGKYIDPMLVNYFQKCLRDSNYKIYETKNRLAETCGIINCNYKVANENKDKLKQYLYCEEGEKVSSSALYHVFQKINDLKKPIISSLSRLQAKSLIEFEMSYIIYFKNDRRLADDIEFEVIKECEESILKELRIEDKNKLRTNDKLKAKYYKKVDELICQELDECDGIYQGFKIIINDNIMNEDKIDNITNIKSELNKLIMEKVEGKMQENKQNTVEKYKYIGEPNPFWPRYVKDTLNEDYINNTNTIIKYIVDIKCKNIADKIINQKMKKWHYADDYFTEDEIKEWMEKVV